MTTRAEKYALAAQAYQKAGIEVGSEYMKRNALKDLVSFMSSQDWFPALDLLKQSNSRIVISQDLEVVSRDVYMKEYVLAGSGFCEVIYEEEDKPLEREFLNDSESITPEKLMLLIEAFQDYQRNTRLVEFIFSELDVIADACPK